MSIETKETSDGKETIFIDSQDLRRQATMHEYSQPVHTETRATMQTPSTGHIVSDMSGLSVRQLRQSTMEEMARR